MFDAKSTTDDVLAGIDLAGKRILVTGVSSGLGVETARALAAHGAQVVGAARDLDKARAATAGIGGLELIELDLASLASVRAAADALIAKAAPFDAIIANAGVMAGTFGRTEDGFEMQFGTNHLGHFTLVNRIAPLIRPSGRVVMVASGGHRFADVDLDDPGFEKTPYEPFIAYGRSKTATILFAVEFDRRHKGQGVRATAIHPGGIATDLGRHMTPESAQKLMETFEADRRAGAPESNISLSRRAPRHRSGPPPSPRPMRWVGAIARIAPSRRSTRRTGSPAAACGPTPSIRRMRRRCGR
ncbi:SDR family NAD(P)-dependent oxidoreductase [Sphingobium chlorophenolicum]|uniref:SDR family NAD(P)-dependent oxidoreductase n=1 Tax=Sphingobium chlorophenolicum TaxID=46429 RepID=UPI0001E545D2|nr:SDR family NAD(P)-dependent oxidoreductase [Sphingobium chlorophenolicum]